MCGRVDAGSLEVFKGVSQDSNIFKAVAMGGICEKAMTNETKNETLCHTSEFKTW